MAGFTTNSKFLYGLNEDDDIGLKINERKRWREDPSIAGSMDIDVGLINSGPQKTIKNLETNISNEDLSISSQSKLATLAM